MLRCYKKLKRNQQRTALGDECHKELKRTQGQRLTSGLLCILFFHPSGKAWFQDNEQDYDEVWWSNLRQSVCKRGFTYTTIPQWNISITDTIGTIKIVLYMEVSLIQSLRQYSNVLYCGMRTSVLNREAPLYFIGINFSLASRIAFTLYDCYETQNNLGNKYPVQRQ